MFAAQNRPTDTGGHSCRMKFLLIDAITDVVPGKRLGAVKALSRAEEYLADHFPKRPVMPGVLMLEVMVQAAAWLDRLTTDYAHSMVLLREARNIKYGHFVTPGEILTVDVKILKDVDGGLLCQGRGRVGQKSAVSGRFEIATFSLADTRPEMAPVDESIRRFLRGLADALVPKRFMFSEQPSS